MKNVNKCKNILLDRYGILILYKDLLNLIDNNAVTYNIVNFLL